MSELRFRRIPQKIPLGVRLLQWIGRDRNRMYRTSVLVLTFFAYTTYHLSRKTISVVKGTLNPNCTQTHAIQLPKNYSGNDKNLTELHAICSGWGPFDTESGSKLLGALDLAFLFSYAVGMFISGFIAEHMDIRHFLTIGMLASGLCSMLFGFGYFWNIHKFSFFVIVQIFFGLFQSSGWPSVVECVGNWFGKGRRGLIMGVWNSHTSVGNILGSAIPGIWASHEWGWSFIVPGIIIASMGIIIFLFLVVEPVHVGCTPPDQHPTPSAGCAITAKGFTSSAMTEETESLLSKSNSMNSSSVSNGKTEDSSPLIKEPSSGECVPVSLNRRAPSIRVRSRGDAHAVGFIKALLIPGVIEYSLCLFFAKLVSYTFLFWLPFYIENTRIGGKEYGAETSADLSTFFDFGGIVGGIFAGVISDKTNCSGITVVVMLFLAGPMLFIYRFLGNTNLDLNVFLMFLSGILVNGPYALITTAVSANLGTHECLQGNTKAMATVTAIIDGTGSMGAALGPLLTGIIEPTGWNNVYYMLIAADVLAAFFLSRQVWFEIKSFCLKRSRRPNRMMSQVEAAYNSVEDNETKQQ